jgi:hypothetical protein
MRKRRIIKRKAFERELGWWRDWHPKIRPVIRIEYFAKWDH